MMCIISFITVFPLGLIADLSKFQFLRVDIVTLAVVLLGYMQHVDLKMPQKWGNKLTTHNKLYFFVQF